VAPFRDVQAERDWLVKRVVPALQQRLEPHRIHLVDIDLRWGITGQQAENDQVLGFCLQQIDECRLFFLGLLGGRYGWVPGEDRTEAAPAETGFSPEDKGASVNALEIKYGHLTKDPGQRLAQAQQATTPLPYDRMPAAKAAVLSEAHATDSGAPERV
jgi:hypothetical protein